jgi:hypothetical protein
MADATAQAKSNPGTSHAKPPRGTPPRLAQTGLPLPLTPPAPSQTPAPGLWERACKALDRAGDKFRQDIQQEVRQDLALAATLPAATAITYEHKQSVNKRDITLLGNGVTLESGKRWSGTWRLDGKYQAAVKRYASAAVTVTFPKTKILGGGPYVEGKAEIAGTGDISFKGWPPQLNSANVDARGLGKGAAGIQGSLLGQSAKLYVQAQGGVRFGTGYNRPFDLAPDTVGTYVVGEAGNHVVKLKIPFVEMLSLSPQAVVTRLTLKAGQRLGEAISEVWSQPKKPTPQPTQSGGLAPQPKRDACPAPRWEAPKAPTTHTVKKGDTLWDIAQAKSGGKWTYIDLAKANADQIKNPDLIYPGQVLRFPTK